MIESSNDSMRIEAKLPGGKIDKVVKEMEVGGMSDKDWGKMLEKPQQFNVNRFGVREIKKQKK